MRIEDIRSELNEISAIVAEWQQSGQMPLIEQDITLAKLAKLYEAVKFMNISESHIEPEEAVEEDHFEDQQPVDESEQIAEDSIFSINLGDISLIEPDKEVESVQNIEENELVDSEETPVETEEEVEMPNEECDDLPNQEILEEIEEQADEEEVKHSDNMLFDMDIIPKKSRSRRSVLMSLYDDDNDKVAASVVPSCNRSLFSEKRKEEVVQRSFDTQESSIVEEEQQQEQNGETSPIIVGSLDAPVKTLADTLVSDVETVGDRLSHDAPRSICDDRVMCHSFDELGINERYLLARDLFGDNPQYCQDMLQTISEFDNYEDAMIFIAENFDWSGESEGAKLILSILEYKFNID